MDELLMERYNLAKNRIREICTEQNVQKNLVDFFRITAEFLCKTAEIMETDVRQQTYEQLEKDNRSLYEELFPENYAISYGNPAYAAEKLGEYGRAFCFLYSELRGTIAYAY